MNEVENFAVESVLGYDTGKPLVKVSWSGVEHLIDTDKAIEISYMLLECAHASESDLSIFNALTNSGCDVTTTANLIKLIRHERAKREDNGEGGG